MNLRLLALALALPVPASMAIASPVTRPSVATAPLAIAARVARWQLSHMGDATRSDVPLNTRGWEQAVFWIGMTALADAGGPADLRGAILAMGNANRWTPGPRPFHADDLAILQPYLWAAEHGAGPDARQSAGHAFNYIVTHRPEVGLAYYQPPEGYDATECLKRWCWSDALFMAPPAMLELSRQTGDRRYADYALREFWATTAFLYDPAEHLYYRDSRFFERRDEHGRKLFWSRGNGWVFASLARMIPLLPPGSPERHRMEKLFVEMADRLMTLQKPDGFWAPSLLAPEGSPPESSGTAFFTYGFAWGISAGLLDAKVYTPTALRGWKALLGAIQADGRIGWVQQVGDQPDRVQASDTQSYGAGAFLLAASAIKELPAR